jgi:MFS family permease
MASTVLGNIIFGYLADIYGHKINLMIMAAVLLLASLSAIAAINPLIFGSVFFFLHLHKVSREFQGLRLLLNSGEKRTELFTHRC